MNRAKQYVNSEPCEVTVHAQKKKKKRQKTWTQQNARKRASQTLTILA